MAKNKYREATVPGALLRELKKLLTYLKTIQATKRSAILAAVNDERLRADIRAQVMLLRRESKKQFSKLMKLAKRKISKSRRKRKQRGQP